VYDVNSAMFRHVEAKTKGSRCSDRWAFECDHDRLLQNWTQQVSPEVSALRLPMFPKLDRELDDALSVPCV
jgi:hypothetical protein